MPSVTSQADIIYDWRGLLEARGRSPELQQGIEPETGALEQSLTEVVSLKGRQEELIGLKQEVSQQLREAIERGKEAAIRFRAVVKARIGPRNERLVQFNMAPIRKRPRKPAVKPPDGEAPGTEPGASASPSTKPVV